VFTAWWAGFSGRHEMTRFALVTWECPLCKGESLTTGPSKLDVGRDARAGDEARTRDPYLGKVAANSVFGTGRYRHLNDYLPANPRGSTLITREATLITRSPR
jgi:hypothetical protein